MNEAVLHPGFERWRVGGEGSHLKSTCQRGVSSIFSP